MSAVRAAARMARNAVAAMAMVPLTGFSRRHAHDIGKCRGVRKQRRAASLPAAAEAVLAALGQALRHAAEEPLQVGLVFTVVAVAVAAEQLRGALLELLRAGYTCVRGGVCVAQKAVLHGQEVDQKGRNRHGLRVDSEGTPSGLLMDSDVFLRTPSLLDHAETLGFCMIGRTPSVTRCR